MENYEINCEWYSLGSESTLEESTYFRTLSIDSFDPLPLLQTNQRKLVKTRNKHFLKKYASEVYSVEKCTGVLQGTYQRGILLRLASVRPH